ncbi:hypothetical protein L873DRAFT_331245 [Choiromyces venosus 120613-1]|uniref:Uncharacterized protein n=1 Tax=Choiromyces venosus 120613-1 TaxID=1336337 RepID=A0A3N4K0D8_9PEZI|nr:hypothetical protein L873DRAFT_331245 [Choiromyces venosus 120613-1]
MSKRSYGEDRQDISGDTLTDLLIHFCHAIDCQTILPHPLVTCTVMEILVRSQPGDAVIKIPLQNRQNCQLPALESVTWFLLMRWRTSLSKPLAPPSSMKICFCYQIFQLVWLVNLKLKMVNMS